MRAAFFHVGVLARMAELGLLRQLQVISTVSGGAITGAVYYLTLLPERPEDDAGYVARVRQLAVAFRRAARHNLRARAFCNPFKKLDMLIRPTYTRSDRIGDLIDLLFCRPAWSETESRLPFVEKQIELRSLYRKNLPTLVLNSTSLNTGHNWRFTPSGMGEPLLEEGTERGRRLDLIDRNARLHGANFEEIATSQRDFPLGLAMAASASFPVLFSPLPISNLYRDMRIRLFDGGLHDNQGVETLRDYECSVIIASDASSQMKDDARPSSLLPSLLGRAISVYGDRVREEQLTALDWDTEGVLLHLREGLPRQVPFPLDNRGEEIEPTVVEPPAESVPGVHPRAQIRVAEIRTDLDAFSDFEVCALMLDGYRIAQARLTSPPLPAELLAGETAPAEPWPFEIADAALRSPTPKSDALLKLGTKRFLKPFLLTRAERIGWSLVLVALVIVVATVFRDPVLAFVGHRALWRGLLVAAPLMLFLPATGWLFARAFELVIPKTLVRSRPAAISRWAVRVLALEAAVIAALLIGSWERLPRWIGMDWSGWETVLAASIVMVAPAAAGLLVGTLMWLEGQAYRARTRLG
jgi:NTE family protein